MNSAFELSKFAKENEAMYLCKYFKSSQKLMGSGTLFSKLMGSAEPMEPMLTWPLYSTFLNCERKETILNCLKMFYLREIMTSFTKVY